jgi:hypothetical protein
VQKDHCSIYKKSGSKFLQQPILIFISIRESIFFKKLVQLFLANKKKVDFIIK